MHETVAVWGRKRIQRGNWITYIGFLETNEEKIMGIKSFTKKNTVSRFDCNQEVRRLRTEERPLKQIQMSLVISVTAVSVTLTSCVVLFSMQVTGVFLIN